MTGGRTTGGLGGGWQVVRIPKEATADTPYSLDRSTAKTERLTRGIRRAKGIGTRHAAYQAKCSAVCNLFAIRLFVGQTEVMLIFNEIFDASFIYTAL